MTPHMKCLEVRMTPEGFKRRRYQGQDPKHRITTIEVPMEVWKGINAQGRGSNRAASFARGQAKVARRLQGLQAVAQGREIRAVARELDVNPATVWRWVQRARVLERAA